MKRNRISQRHVVAIVKGEPLIYFRSLQQATESTHALIADPARRAKLSSAVCARLKAGNHTYPNRFSFILNAGRVYHRGDSVSKVKTASC
jgi:spore maturation protein CgeB